MIILVTLSQFTEQIDIFRILKCILRKMLTENKVMSVCIKNEQILIAYNFF